MLKWPNLRALSYDSLLILTHKLHCTSKANALKWPVLKNDTSNSIVWTLNKCWIFFRDNCFLKICLSGIQVGYQTVQIQIMPNILTWTCLRLLTKFISEIALAGKYLMLFKFKVSPIRYFSSTWIVVINSLLTSVVCWYICKQFGPRSGPTKRRAWSGSKLLGIQLIFPKDHLGKTTTINELILKKYQQTTKPWQITSKARRVNELKWKVLHVHACFMLKPYICLLSIRHGLGPLLRVCVCVSKWWRLRFAE